MAGAVPGLPGQGQDRGDPAGHPLEIVDGGQLAAELTVLPHRGQERVERVGAAVRAERRSALRPCARDHGRHLQRGQGGGEVDPVGQGVGVLGLGGGVPRLGREPAGHDHQPVGRPAVPHRPVGRLVPGHVDEVGLGEVVQGHEPGPQLPGLVGSGQRRGQDAREGRPAPVRRLRLGEARRQRREQLGTVRRQRFDVPPGVDVDRERHLGPGVLQPLPEVVQRVPVRPGEHHQADAGTGERPRHRPAPGTVQALLPRVGQAAGLVDVLPQADPFLAQLGDLPLERGGEPLAQRPGPQHDADGERDEDGHQGDEVVTEVDHLEQPLDPGPDIVPSYG